MIKLKLLFILILLSYLFFLSCSEDITYDEYIIGYAGTSGLSFTDTDSSIVSTFSAYKFENHDKIKVTINEEVLPPFLLYATGSAAQTKQTVKVPNEGILNLTISYEGRKSEYSQKLLPKMTFGDLAAEYDSVQGITSLNWTSIDDADYYSVDVLDDYYNSVIWDTLMVEEFQLEFSNDFFGDVEQLQVYVTAIKGPHPDIEYYNLKGDVSGRFVLASQSYIYLKNPEIFGNVKSTSNLKLNKTEEVVRKNILNRYLNLPLPQPPPFD